MWFWVLLAWDSRIERSTDFGKLSPKNVEEDIPQLILAYANSLCLWWDNICLTIFLIIGSAFLLYFIRFIWQKSLLGLNSEFLLLSCLRFSFHWCCYVYTIIYKLTNFIVKVTINENKLIWSWYIWEIYPYL